MTCRYADSWEIYIGRPPKKLSKQEQQRPEFRVIG